MGLFLDLRYSLRQLRVRPGFSAVVILTLGLGVAAATSILSVANVVFVRPLPFSEPEQLYAVFSHQPAGGASRLFASYPDYRDWREQNDVFESLTAAASYVTVTLERQDEPHQLRANLVDASFFPLLDAQAFLGRTFQPEDDRAPLGEPVAILSYAVWQNHFGGDTSILGRSMRLSGQTYTVVGVMGAEFQDPLAHAAGFRTDVWLPLTRYPAFQDPPPGHSSVLEARFQRFLGVLGRLRPGVTAAQASEQMVEIARRLEEEHPGTNQGNSVLLMPLRELYFEDVNKAILLLLFGAALLLLIVSANVANLYTVRALARRREMAIRMAIGASQRVLIRQLLVEGLTLAVAGGLLGILLAVLSLESLLALNPIRLPDFSRVQVDFTVFSVCLGATVLASLVFNLLPAVQGTRAALSENLAGARGSGGSLGSMVARKSLIIGEIALTVVLLVAAALLARTLANLSGADPGFQSSQRLTFNLDMRGARYASPEAKQTLVQQAVSRLSALPGVENADVWQPDAPGEMIAVTSVVKEGETADPAIARVVTRYKAVSPSALTHAGISILRGRDIGEMDRLGMDTVAVISQSLARHLWPNEEAVGKRFRRTTRPEWYTVVGVAADVKHQGQLFSQANPRDTYFSLHQYPGPNISLVVKTAGDPASATGGVRQAIREIDPTLVLYKIRTLEEVVATEAKPARFATVLSGVFASLAVGLALLGVYGVLVFSVSRRSGEFGIRLALGATPGHIFRLVMGEGGLLAGVGLALGVATSLGLSRWLASMLFGISPVDPFTYAGILVALAALVLLTCYVPARRATRVDPFAALRSE